MPKPIVAIVQDNLQYHKAKLRTRLQLREFGGKTDRKILKNETYNAVRYLPYFMFS